MADFSYRFLDKELHSEKFEDLYQQKMQIIDDLQIYYNKDTVTHITQGDQSITILGYVYNADKDTTQYLHDSLANFNEENISEIKQQLLGQYIALIRKGDFVYLFSDFLQVRSIYYSIEDKIISSSFDYTNAATGHNTDPYKEFEFIALRHCSYPAWLGNSTLNPSVKRLRAFEYLKIHVSANTIEAKNIVFPIDNQKEESLSLLKENTLNTFRKVVRHAANKNKKVHATITGGFDSRLITSLINEYYTDINLKISIHKKTTNLDYEIARKVAKKISLPLKVYETDLDKQKEWFYSVTDSLSPKENAIITDLLQHTNDCAVGFGGTFGTELHASFGYNTIDEVVQDFLNKARHAVKAEKAYYERFEQALRQEFDVIKNHYLLKTNSEKDLFRLFRLINTAYFASPMVSAYNIYGNQFEPFATYPIIVLGLKIPYKYLGGKGSFGRFYFIPKSLMEKINRKVSHIITSHFYPMRPLSVFSIIAYVMGWYSRRKYYERLTKSGSGSTKNLEFKGEKWQYTTSNEWIEGFAQKYLKK